MTDRPIDALGGAMRRRIFQMLVDEPRSVGELAAELPVSRPAVSQHLKSLLDADLVRATRVGTRNVYAVDPAGISQLRAWVEQMWDAALTRFAAAAAGEENTMTKTHKATIAPVFKVLDLPVDAEKAFDLFTDGIDRWWPLATHSASESPTTARVEPRLGGRIYEVDGDGAEHDWGTITEWVPGKRVVFTWHPALPTHEQTKVDVRFEAIESGCRVLLIHDGWEARGEAAPEVREGYDSGWDIVLGQYVDLVTAEAG